MLYTIWLLQQNEFLNQETEKKFLEYIWNRKDGIYYCAGGPLSNVECLESKSFLTWLSGIENLSGFSLFPEFMKRGIIDHLLHEVHRLMHEEVNLPSATPIFGHYSEKWSNRRARKDDLILRIVRVLVKCYQ